ncbi:hypothetical protein BH09SUM1_BH09SUM1_27320 [soil metagenome]
MGNPLRPRLGIIAFCSTLALGTLVYAFFAGGPSFGSFATGWMSERESVWKMLFRINSKIVDDSGRPLDDVLVTIHADYPSGFETSGATDSVAVSRQFQREWKGVAAVNLSFDKVGYRSQNMQFMKPKAEGNSDANTTMTLSGAWYVYDKDVVLRKRAPPSAPLKISPHSFEVVGLMVRKDSSFTFLTSPTEGSMKARLADSATTAGLEFIGTAQAYVRLKLVSAPGIERVSYVNSMTRVVHYKSPADTQPDLGVVNGQEGDGFISADAADVPENPEWYYPDDMTEAPASGYNLSMPLPIKFYSNPAPYHYFYCRINGHYGKGYWRGLFYGSHPEETMLSEIEEFHLVVNPTANDRNVATGGEREGL